MQFKSLALVALAAAGASAQSSIDPIAFSVLSVLATGIPAESQSLARNDPSAFSVELASSLAAGNTPSWYQALPTDVKSYLPKLYPATAVVTTTASETAAVSTVFTSSTAFPSGPTGSTRPLYTASSALISGTGSIPQNSTAVSTVSSATLHSTGGANSQATTALTGGASYPTAVVGAGIAGALGFLGMLAM